MVDVPDNTSTTATLAFGGTYNGEIETAGDEDWVAVTLQAGVTYAIQMTGATVGDGTLADPFIKGLYDANGTSLGRFDDDGAGNRNSQLVFTPDQSGTYYVSAGAWETETGTYEMSLGEYEAEAPSPTTNAVVDEVDTTGDVRVDSLLDLFRYQNVTGGETTAITYSFPNAASAWSTSSNGGYGPEDGDGEPWNGVDFLSQAEQDLFRDALSEIESFAAVSFDEVADNASSAGTIRVAWTDLPDEGTAAYAFTPYPTVTAGDIWLVSENQSTGGRGSYFHLVLTHELGHAMGLKHPFDEDGSGVVLPSYLDGLEYTVMSYNVSADDEDILGASFYPTSYMYYDILALQYLYGEAENATGDTRYIFEYRTNYYETIWDTGGIDTYDASDQFFSVNINLTPGSWSDVGTDITLYRDGGPNTTKEKTVFTPPEVIIENAIGGEDNDRITGNDAANVLIGNDGGDTIRGGAGDDRLLGGDGRDSLDGGGGDDTLNGGDAADYLSGGGGNDVFWAGDDDDSIYGGAGNDTIGTGSGDDIVDGGAGANLIFGFHGDDSITVAPDDDTAGDGIAWGGEGVDTIDGGSGNDRIGTANGDDLAYGHAGDDTLFGGTEADNDTLDGGSGDDIIYGGAGDDDMTGGSGDDLFYGGAGDDVINTGSGGDELVFAAGHGDDIVTDFSVGDDLLDLSDTHTNFTSASSVQAAATNTTVGGDAGVMLNTGGGDSIFLIGLTTANLATVDYTF